MKPQHFVVTGGTSFIGRPLVRRLLDGGGEITILTRDISKVLGEWHGRVEMVEGDVREKKSLSKLPFEESILFHLAGEIQKKSLFFDTNVKGTRNIMDLALKGKIKHFIYLSSIGVFGYSKQSRIGEDVSCHPIDEYEKSKYEGEKILVHSFENYKVPTTILRPSTVFGEESKNESFLSWMKAIKNRTFRFIGNDAHANYIYVGDLVEALILVSKANLSGKEVFIVNDAKPMREFINAAAEILRIKIPQYSVPKWVALLGANTLTPIAKMSGKNFPLSTSRVRALTDRRIFSAEKIEKELGFKPIFGIVEGLMRTIQWYEKKGLL